jgi:hypothetical protein
MKEMRCPMCGSQIAMVRQVPEQYFYIDEDGEVERDSNVDFQIGIYPNYEPICSNDRTHDIYPLLGTPRYKEFMEWCDEFESECIGLLEKRGL